MAGHQVFDKASELLCAGVPRRKIGLESLKIRCKDQTDQRCHFMSDDIGNLKLVVLDGDLL